MADTEAVSGRVEPETKRRLEAAAEAMGVPLSELVRRGVERYARENPENLAQLRPMDSLDQFTEALVK